MIIAKNSMLSESEILEILKKEPIGIKLNYECNLEYDIETAAKTSSRVKHDFSKNKEKYICFCEKGYKSEIKKYCPHCGTGIYRRFNEFNTKEYTDNLKAKLQKMDDDITEYNKTHENKAYADWYYGHYESKKKIYDKFFVYKHPEYEHGIIIKKIVITAEAKKEDIILSGKIEKCIEIVPGEFSKAYAYKRGAKEDMDLFAAFNLSSNTAKYQIEMDWENSKNMLEFLNSHKDFTKRTAILDVFTFSDHLIYKNNFFMIYMYLYAEYPVFELLAKMNYSKMLSESITKVLKSCNKADMRKNADELEKVFNPHGTTGKLSLNIPKYIGDYLNLVGATYKDFEDWSDIYAYEKLSKENFFALVDSEIFVETYSFLHRYPDLLKYGYTITKVNNYIEKQSLLLKLPKTEIIRLIIDYQKTLELLGAEIDLYPSDIKDVHDKAFRNYQLVKNEVTDRRLKEIKSEALSSVNSNDNYEIVIPETTVEFIDEGNRQHNCVATYVNQVINNRCFIFFIRKKDKPNDSYITAEYRYGKLYQIKEKNNYSVTNPEATKFAKEFCEKLSKTKYFKNI